jgi:UDP-N-acetylmuramoyl-L-alanyl-D-glutamate--2,6-diaminopimelate ligase
MKLREIAPADAKFEARHAEIEIGGVTADSRKVKRGDAFVAIAGGKTDGLRFVDAAIAAGAAAIIAEHAASTPPPARIAVMRVANARRALASIAAKYYPRQPRTIAAVTGTSGKTSVAAFVRQIWQSNGHSAASIGTIGIVSPGGERYGALTTPDPVDLLRSIDALAAEGVTHLAIEASSHGLDQYRLDGLRLSAAAFTNITRDHLDYHVNFEAYLAAKLRLFDELLPQGAAAIIDVDHEHADAVVAVASARGLAITTVGRKGTGIRLLDSSRDGTSRTRSPRRSRRCAPTRPGG